MIRPDKAGMQPLNFDLPTTSPTLDATIGALAPESEVKVPDAQGVTVSNPLPDDVDRAILAFISARMLAPSDACTRRSVAIRKPLQRSLRKAAIDLDTPVSVLLVARVTAYLVSPDFTAAARPGGRAREATINVTASTSWWLKVDLVALALGGSTADIIELALQGGRK